MDIKKSLDKIRPVFRNIVLPIYWAFLTFMLLKPGVENKEYWFMFPGIDKLIHLSIFAFLGFTLLIAFKRLRVISFVTVVSIYGLGTEILQNVMHLGRSFEVLDILADVAGALIGFFTYLLLLKFSRLQSLS